MLTFWPDSIPKSFFLPPSVLLFILPQIELIELEGWKQHSQKKAGNSDTLCHVRYVHRSDEDVSGLWFSMSITITFPWELWLSLNPNVAAESSF